MSLIDKIENMHKKPDHVKRRIVFASVFVIMFIIVAAWVSTLKLTAGSATEKKAAVSSPFAVFGEMISDGVDEITGALSGTIEGLNKVEVAETTETEKTNGEQQQQ